MRIGIFNGSFNPVHKGHIEMINYALDNKLVDKVLVIPTNNYWDKKIEISLIDRTNMLKFYETDSIIIDNEFSSYIYTIDLLNEVKKKYLNDELILMLGSDNVLNIHKWKEYENLIKYEFIIFPRGNTSIKEIKDYLISINKDNYIIADKVPNSISSTYIRDNMDCYDKLKDYVDKEIYKYYKNTLKGPK